ncbi:hypothetical protein M409DRAFT_20808 [Zasmidium cellare ATCC 36951]|uniref:Uncharacterized protein n=1 Tax=Zasmidium cellare ATCC 36951 TaxID=1080233 RepID=A0A6A6CSJ6_ZASCE|nr:uncharacterized protein M409DRAFT_20808 [Zasmidium cellare ATCC 36951]KAF2168792.1 hypothetical protein M409DRAFT_20808 [Zasmidium cellare ATCC 36951]
MYATLALALAAVGSALPAPQSHSATGATPPKDQEFGLAMKVDGSLVSLNAVSNGSTGGLVLEGERLSVYPGTPAYLNGTSEYRALNFDIAGTAYGIATPEVGDNYGFAASVFAIEGFQQFEWTVASEKIDHKRDAALNQFYACKDVAADGVENVFLKWGTQGTDGQPPVGCQSTEVVQNFNVEGGLKSGA